MSGSLAYMAAPSKNLKLENQHSNSKVGTCCDRRLILQLPIYDEPEKEALVVPTEKPELAKKIGTARTWLISKLQTATEKSSKATDNVVDSVIGVESRVEKDLKSVAPQNGESLLPGLIYVIVSGFAGSIVARNRKASFLCPSS